MAPRMNHCRERGKLVTCVTLAAVFLNMVFCNATEDMAPLPLPTDENINLLSEADRQILVNYMRKRMIGNAQRVTTFKLYTYILIYLLVMCQYYHVLNSVLFLTKQY